MAGKIDNRIKIMSAALELFQTIGYFQCDIRKIAAAAGIGLGTFYNYFKTKKELYLVIFEEEYLKISLSLTGGDTALLLNELSLKQIISLIVKKHFEAHTHTLLFYRETAAMIALDDDVRELNEKLDERSAQQFLQIFELKKSEMREVDPTLALNLIINALDENIHSLVGCTDTQQVEQTLAELIEMIYRYLKTE